jgi:predicted nucleic acid-binding protein
MGKAYLVDTNALIDFLALRLPPKGHQLLSGIVDNGMQISVVVKIELLSISTGEKALKALVDSSETIPLDDELVEMVISLRRSKRIKLPDAIIAATAVRARHILVTRNVRDFSGIAGLEVLDPYEV